MRKTEITKHELQVIEQRFVHYAVPVELQAMIREAIRSLNTGEFIYDGTTLDEELAPNNIEEASLLHDYQWAKGWGGWLSNVVYSRALKVYKASRVTRGYRFVGITIGWYFGYMWKYMAKRELRQIPKRFYNLNKAIK